jgi:hypothetical protein
MLMCAPCCDVQGKPFAIYGFGDAVRFKNNFADAISEVGAWGGELGVGAATYISSLRCQHCYLPQSELAELRLIFQKQKLN